MLVVNVKDGVAPPELVPAKPLAEATETAVTVPVAGVVHVGAALEPFDVNTWPEVP